MNALIVDDDYFVIKALETRMDWRTLQIEQVYTADNIAQARDIITHHPIHILISDIDMPQGSGLELLAWIRDQGYDIQAIILTNYADFNYAQKAIELQSFEYFLKPIEFDKLMLIIQKAVARAKEHQSNELAKQEGYFWKKNQVKIFEHFWRQLINSSQSFPMKPADIALAIDEQQLPYRMEDTFHSLLIHLFPYNNSMGITDKGLFDYAIINVWNETFQSSTFSVEAIMEYKEYNWIAIVRWSDSPDHQTMEELCTSFIVKANQYLKADASCSIGIAVALGRISQSIKQLVSINEELAKSRNQIFFVEQYERQLKRDYEPPNLQRLEELLYQNKPAEFVEEASSYLRGYVEHQVLDKSILSLFRLDITQLVYSFLKSKEILTHRLYSGKSYERLFAHALHSIENMEEYIAYLVETATEYREFTKQSKSVVEEVKQYIHSHIGDDLSRNSLAEIIYLNPDYLARVFKKETGISLGSYITQARIAAAKHLLETTTLSVYAVAKKVGYANYSYFSKLFKQDVGLSPNEYKKGVV
ncbi:response regulator [Paenibacillus camelliae]|uniref:response regulator n=1 Tax=Paenibacillus camelliae TaxID=512410 RepID=UPI002041D681|nr:helix-turn-helix domain-containing protein [Paenibacillus camelliae]MCM3634270.1 response regulator [Paenibacillus camelliae]